MRKLLSPILCLVLICALIFSTAVFTHAADILGDVDGNGNVAILDATAIQRHLANLDALDESAIRRGMVCGNDKLSILDATEIQRYLAGLVNRFPTEITPTQPTQPATQPTTQAPTQPATEPATEPREEVTKVKNTITVYFSNNKGWTTVNAYVYNQASGATMSAWPGTAMKYVTTNDMGEKVYSVTADVTKYDRVIFNNGTYQTTDTPLTKANSGYFLNSKRSQAYGNKFLAGLYPYGESGEGKITTVQMDYPEGYKKPVYIWTPEGYNAADKSKKYSVLYMCDGQNLFGQMTTLSGYEWECDETVLSLMKNGGDGVIVVGVDNSTNKRDHELTPNLGKLSSYVSGDTSYQNGGGKVYSDFVVDTVIPYVEKNYNVNSIRGIAGSSSGGIEAFYIGMEHLDKFRYVGALSPAFLLFDKPVWDSYLGKKDFSGEMPRIYFFCGNGSDQLEQELYKDSVLMEGWLKNYGYPADKMKTVTDSDGTHSEGFWALYFPEMLSWGLEL